MAEFEELRLTVNLVDNASAGLANIRTQLAGLTQTAGQTATAVASAATQTQQLASATEKAAPAARGLDQEMKGLTRSAEAVGRGLMQTVLAARRGAEAFPEMALGLREASEGVKGLNEGMAVLAPSSRVAVVALGGLALGVAAVGAAVVAYGVSVFKFSREMYQLGQTARSLGMTFGALKDITDQGAKFGVSADVVIRGMAGIQQAQTNLSRNNSELRQRLQGMGLDPNWLTQFQRETDPAVLQNMVRERAKAIEQEQLRQGKTALSARGTANQFIREFGLDPGILDNPALKPLRPDDAARYKEIAKLSEQIAEQWGEMAERSERTKTAIMAWGLPYVLDVLIQINHRFDSIVEAVKTIAGYAGKVAPFIPFVGPSISGGRAASDALGSILRQRDANDAKTGPDSGMVDSFRNQQEQRQNFMDQLRKRSSFSADNDNIGLLHRASFTSREMIDQTDKNTAETTKLTQQLERLNAFFDRSGNQTTAGRQPGISTASLSGEGGGFGGGGIGGGVGGGGGGSMLGGSTMPGRMLRGLLGGGSVPALGGGGARSRAGGGGDAAGGSDGSSPAGSSEEAIAAAQQGGGAAGFLAAKRAPFAEQLKDPGTRKLLGAIISAENPGAGPAVAESLMNRTELVNASRARRGLPPLTLRDMMVGHPSIGGGKSFYGPMRSGAINAHLAKMNNPAFADQMNQRIDRALGGSNTVQSNTDQGSAGDPNYITGGVGVNINRERFNDWGYPGSRAWREQRQRDLAAAASAPARRGPTPSYPSAWYDMRSTQRSMLGDPDRNALDRPALSRSMDINSTGRLSVDVKAPPGTSVDYQGDNLLRATQMQRQTQMTPTTQGPSVSDTASSYMAGGF